MKIEKLQNPYVRGNEGCSVSMIDLLEKINEIIDAMNGEHDPADIYSEDGRLIAKKDESEDERIRKALVWHLKAGEDFVSNGVTKAECIAYLEKQKEQRPALSEVELLFRGEKVTVKRPFYRDDKGRGYSTTEQDEEVAWNALRAWCEKKGISLYDLYPKAEWSEEDADILNCCISSIEEAKENRYAYKETDGDTSYDHEIAWLKSLRPSWKPSDQDELMKLKYAGTSTKLD